MIVTVKSMAVVLLGSCETLTIPHPLVPQLDEQLLLSKVKISAARASLCQADSATAPISQPHPNSTLMRASRPAPEITGVGPGSSGTAMI